MSAHLSYGLQSEFARNASVRVTLRDITGDSRPYSLTVKGETNASASRTAELLSKMERATATCKRPEGQDKDEFGNKHGAPRLSQTGKYMAALYENHNSLCAVLDKSGVKTIAEYNAIVDAENAKREQETKPADDTKPRSKRAARKSKTAHTAELHTVPQEQAQSTLSNEEGELA